MLVEVAKKKQNQRETIYMNSNLNTCMKDIVDMEKFTNLKICMLSFGIFQNRNNNYKCVRLMGIIFYVKSFASFPQVNLSTITVLKICSDQCQCQ